MEAVIKAALLTSLLVCAVVYGSSESNAAPGKTTAPRTTVLALMNNLDYGTMLAMSTVDGIAVRIAWKILEPAQDNYNWTIIDSAVAAASVTGKKVTLHIFPTGTGTPSWLYSSQPAASSYTYTSPATGASVTDPVPWDNVYLTQWSNLIAAIADHLTTSGMMTYIQAISVTAPVLEMSIVGCSDGRLTPALAYSRTDYLAAWQTTISAVQQAFPASNKFLPVPVDSICKADFDGPAFYKELLDYALQLDPTGFSSFATDLNAQGSWRMNGILSDISRAPVALQFIWSASNDPYYRMAGTLIDAICSGLNTYGGSYFEVYQDDLSSTVSATQQAIEAIHTPSLCNKTVDVKHKSLP
ncbi:MAG: beta-galactosidase [Gallionellaceae bacterium]|nr:beta-galactosidase [Gallionellaceae bacterium]